MNRLSASETQPKKPYNTPELTEHGTVEEITGFDTGLGPSGGIPD
ncbi:MAG: lasso RiPP family leader peptide-containing protein [Acidobacteriia bacterium]|nr:lasso RiPP family leader peptide-containing protein [Terriglobia bacterium]